MRVNLVFPPSLCLPNQIYYALPLLAGALQRGGHVPRSLDLNLVAADMLLSQRRAEAFGEIAEATHRDAVASGNVGAASAIRRNIDENLPIVMQGQACKEALRDPVRFYHRPTFNHAFWSIVRILAVYYQLDPIISPFQRAFRQSMHDNQATDPWSVMTLLWEDGLLDAALVGDPEMIGISLAFPEQAAEAVRLARKVKARDPSLHVCFGGPLITSDPGKWLEDDWLFDYCDSLVIGDGESAIVELCDALEGRRAMESVRNLVYRDPGGRVQRGLRQHYLEDMDDLPVPDFATADMSLQFLPEPVYPLMLSRGCYWGKCTFCSDGWKKNYRMASAQKIAADVREVTQHAGGRFIYLQDSSVPPKGASIVSEVIRSDGVEASWYGGMRFEPSLLDPDLCRQWSAGGCRSLCMGFESSDQRLLDLMAKGIRFDDVVAILDNLQAVEISAELLWFVGFPTQTRRDVYDTAKFLFDRRDRFGLTAFVGSYALHPDSEVFERPADFGITLVEEVNDQYAYDVASGIGMTEVQELKRMLSGNDNRTLTCNGSHLPHLAVTTRNTVGLSRATTLPTELADYCGVTSD